ncbi:MAG TPA: hypothetical protein VKF36_01490 [Syntrophorhabdales bacterium]|nr:hypothetical protein [Syntrophorhabdales bacterium]
MRKFLLVLLLCILPVLANAAPTVFPHGVTIYKPDKCWNGYTLLAKLIAVKPGEEPTDYNAPLIDMNGNVVHEWKNVIGYPVKLLPGGRLMGGLHKPGRAGIDADAVAQFDFDGNIEWQWDKAEEVQVKGPDGKLKKIWVARQHHDFQREPNPVGYYAPGQDAYVDKGRTLILGRGVNAVTSGKDYKWGEDHERIMEVDWQGNIVWDFHGKDHKDDGVSRPDGGAWGGNAASWVGPNKWYDAGDERFHPDNIIMDNLTDVIWIFSKKTGKVTWQVGPDYSKYPQLAKLGVDRKEFLGRTGGFVGGMLHNAHMIPKGLPGEGNILVFNNGLPYSLVTEFNPVTLEVVWEYGGPALGYGESHSLAHYFSSPSISSAQRLPNGNTMICEGDGGRIFEVTKELETVWEYIYPVYHWPGLGGVHREHKQLKKVTYTNAVYRAYRYPYSYVPQLKKPVERSVTPPKLQDWRLPVDK